MPKISSIRAALGALLLVAAVAPSALAQSFALTIRNLADGPALYRIDLASGDVSEIGSFGMPELQVARSLTYLPSGELIAVSVTGALVLVDPATGQATPAGDLGTTFYPYVPDLAADACGRIWMLADGGPDHTELWSIDPTTGTGDSLGVLPEWVFGIAAYGEDLYGLANGPGLDEQRIVKLDPESLEIEEISALPTWSRVNPVSLDFDSEGELFILGWQPVGIPPFSPQLLQRTDLAGNVGPSLGPGSFGIGLAVGPPPGQCLSGSPLPIPTASPLGLIGLALLLATAGTLFLVQRRAKVG